jgi:hypothetical protein
MLHRKVGAAWVAWVAACVFLVVTGPRATNLPAAADMTAVRAWLLADPQHALVTAVASVAWLVLAWLALGTVLVAGGRCVGGTGRWCRRLDRLLLPRVIRTGLEAAIGLTVVVGSGIPALAATPGVATTAARSAGGSASTATAIPSLDRRPPSTIQLNPLPAVPAPVLAPPAPGGAQPDPAVGAAPVDERPEIVVRRGDCLWSVVHRHLGPEASDAEIAAAWPTWFAANRAVIGPDPGLLLPGQRLHPPATSR